MNAVMTLFADADGFMGDVQHCILLTNTMAQSVQALVALPVMLVTATVRWVSELKSGAGQMHRRPDSNFQRTMEWSMTNAIVCKSN